MSSIPGKDEILSGLRTKTFGRTLYTFSSIDSTNTCARTLAEAGTGEGTVVWSDHQTAGKGRLGRAWTDEAGKNLLFSVVLRDLPDKLTGRVSFYVAEAVALGIGRTTGLAPAAKWPNDLLLAGRKVCGILLEASEEPGNRYVVAGVGINVNQQDFPADLSGTATSLALKTGAPVDRKALFRAIMIEMEALFSELRSDGDVRILSAWQTRCETIGRSVTVRNGKDLVDGRAIGLSPEGGLILETNAGVRILYAGDVSITVSEAPETP